jgi:hypothetical protein
MVEMVQSCATIRLTNLTKTRGKHGGKRPGQRPPTGQTWKWPKTMAKDAARELVRQAITAHLEPLIAAQVANAKGLQYLVYRDKKTGKFERVKSLEDVNQDDERIEVWEKDPSVQAFTDLLNRAIDKPKEQVQEIALLTDETLSRLDRAKLRARNE